MNTMHLSYKNKYDIMNRRVAPKNMQYLYRKHKGEDSFEFY